MLPNSPRWLQQVIQRRPQGRQPQAAGDNQDVLARHPVHRPGDPEGTPHSQHLSPLQAADGPGDVPHVPDGVHQGFGAGRIAADGDGHLAGPEGIEHVELARGKGKVRRARRPGSGPGYRCRRSPASLFGPQKGSVALDPAGLLSYAFLVLSQRSFSVGAGLKPVLPC